ncbi:MAG TPA: methionine biosynthesis protein MetW [Opitutales bacterium]|nr:methionine biosynthesis protein MetW [Opitutales bacterium]
MTKTHSSIKRETDLQIISGWVEPGSRVLDLGCGRGVLLEQLRQKKDVKAIGVDIDAEKIEACVRRGIPAYQGDAASFLREFDEYHFDWIILSRTVQELDNPAAVIREALRAGKNLAVGFENHGYWRNRLADLFTGRASHSASDEERWPDSRTQNPVSIAEFEAFCAREGLEIRRRVLLAGDWKSAVSLRPSLRAAYALYAVSKAK